MIDKNVLYFTRTMGLGGTEKVIMQLCKNFNDKFNKIIVCSMGGEHEDELSRMGIKHYKINDIENKNIFNIIKTFVVLLKIIRTENIDIIHTHHRMAAFYVSIITMFKKVKFIHTAHNTFFNKKSFTRISLKKANIVAVGEKVKNNLCEFYKLDESKITVIYNGVDNYDDNIREVPEIKKYKDKGYFLIGNIGRLSEQKGMEYYIESIPDILKKNNKFMFYIIGEGEGRGKLELLAKDLKVENNIIFLGYRNDVINIIKQLDLVVLSSLWEGLPLTPIETFSVGKTIVATDVDGTSEVVKNNYNGLLIKSRDAYEIYKSILSLWENEALKKQLEKNALKTYTDLFTIEKFNKNYEDYYRKIIY